MQDQNSTSNANGAGLNLRLQYLDQIISEQPKVGFWEVIAENLFDNANALEKVEAIAGSRPIHLHCVGMNIGGVDPIDETYLEKISDLTKRINPRIVSDHLCFQRHGGISHFDLLPFALNQDSLKRCKSRLKKIQDLLGHPVLIENLCYYLEFKDSNIDECVFISDLCNSLDTKLILDLNNIYLNSVNLGISHTDYLKNIPKQLIGEIHIAGGELIDGVWVDTHGSDPSDKVIEILKDHSFSKIPICYERDNKIPPLNESLKIVEKINNQLELK